MNLILKRRLAVLLIVVMAVTTSLSFSTVQVHAAAGQQAADLALDLAKKEIPYVHAGKTPNGFDCSGFTYYVYKQLGITIPASTAGQKTIGVKIDSTALKASGDVSLLQPGDLILFDIDQTGDPGHVGMYVGNGDMVHASLSKGLIKIGLKTPSGKGPWYSVVYNVRRIENTNAPCTHQYVVKHASEHPHKEYKECTKCGAKSDLGSNAYSTACTDCWKLGSASGKCGENLTWQLIRKEAETERDCEGLNKWLLYISGTGPMYNYTKADKYSSTAPWGGVQDQTVIEEGVTSIGDYAFYDGIGSEIFVPKTVDRSGINAFALVDDFEDEDGAAIRLFAPKGSFAELNLKKEGMEFYDLNELNAMQCGKKLTWSFDSGSKTLYIKGTGSMHVFFVPKSEYSKGKFSYARLHDNEQMAFEAVVPWEKYRYMIKTISIENGVENIGKGAFANCSAEKVLIPTSVKSIDAYAFAGTSLKKQVIPSTVKTIGTDALTWSDVTLSEGLETLGDVSVNYDSVIVPKSVKKMGELYIGIADEPTMGIDGDSYVQGYAGSYAEEYVKNYKASIAASYLKTKVKVPFYQVDKKKVITQKPELVDNGYSFETTYAGACFLTNTAVADGCELYRSDSRAGTYKKVAVSKDISSAAQFVSDKSNLKLGKTYYYKARTYVKVNGKKYYSGYSSVKKSTIRPRKAYVGLQKTGSGKVNIYLSTSGKADGYIVYRATSKKGTYKKVKTVSAGKYSTTVTDTGLKKGKTYYYKAKAFKKSGGKTYYSDFSDIASQKM